MKNFCHLVKTAHPLISDQCAVHYISCFFFHMCQCLTIPNRKYRYKVYVYIYIIQSKHSRINYWVTMLYSSKYWIGNSNILLNFTITQKCVYNFTISYVQTSIMQYLYNISISWPHIDDDIIIYILLIVVHIIYVNIWNIVRIYIHITKNKIEW